jgi:hypothetical protein
MDQERRAKGVRRRDQPSSATSWLLRIGALAAVAFAGYQRGQNEGRTQGQTEGRIIEASRCTRRADDAREDERANCRAAVGTICEEPLPPYGRTLCERLDEALH